MRWRPVAANEEAVLGQGSSDFAPRSKTLSRGSATDWATGALEWSVEVSAA